MISDFVWQRGVTPLSSFTAVVTCVALYCTTVALLPKLIRRPIAVPTAVSGLHNLVLCFGSLAMLLGCANEIVRVSYLLSSVLI